MTDITLSDELDVVNTMLGTIGMAPINSLASDTKNAEVVVAEKVLYRTSRAIQTLGWDFNTEEDFPLSRDVDGYITLGENFLSVDFNGRYTNNKYVLRGTRVYDRQEHTFILSEDLKCEAIVFLPFNELPQVARHYIGMKAVVKFQDQTTAAEDLHAYTADDAMEAKRVFESVHTSTKDATIFDNSEVYAIVDRGYMYPMAGAYGPTYWEN